MAQENGRAKGGYIGLKGRREHVREEKDGGGKEESKGKSGCAHPKLNPGCATAFATYFSTLWPL